MRVPLDFNVFNPLGNILGVCPFLVDFFGGEGLRLV